ncbi:tRNA pseudouridine(38/39) synthase-like isoform X4 [Brachypodium distachyon]|uniref:tRNA pseudouridine(38/39) synthase-like isoform X4 n=1 Tax=Brachypodium distachyon TaxID=15368 RepID=UPI000D0DD337|nr:tRNA pseudouridine(38/39) synthase-like isoform X4 [Brachypodium distachyon]|eukprot:XP_024318618.1 tRNA pseudouridine(38/39) synthase-like isoform X4 [Brachypodium distachyon]
MLNGVLGSILMLLMLFLGNKVEKLCGLCNITLNKTAVFGDTSASAINLVISLYLRSNLKDPGGNVLDERSEIDYVKVLNRMLPRDIRVIGWCPVAADFLARSF